MNSIILDFLTIFILITSGLPLIIPRYSKYISKVILGTDEFDRAPVFEGFNMTTDFDFVDLDSLDHMFSEIEFIENNGLRLVNLPEGTILHKSMKSSSNSFMSQQDVFNLYAAKPSWFSNFKIAQKYSEMGYGNVMSFRVIKNLTLFDINSYSNWAFLWSKMEKQLDYLQTIDLPIGVSRMAKPILQSDIDRLKLQMKVIQLTVGFNVTWAEQRQLLIDFGDAITNNYNFRPLNELEERNSDADDWFLINDKSVVLRNLRTNDTFGSRREDLNRISFTSLLDINMLNTITEYLNVDGYYSARFPSLFHNGGALSTELAIKAPKYCLLDVSIQCKDGFYACGDSCYLPNDSIECLPGGILRLIKPCRNKDKNRV